MLIVGNGDRRVRRPTDRDKANPTSPRCIDLDDLYPSEVLCERELHVLDFKYSQGRYCSLPTSFHDGFRLSVFRNASPDGMDPHHPRARRNKQRA